MLISRTLSRIVSLPIGSGVTITQGKAVGMSSGEAVLADKDQQISALGLAKSIQGSIVYIQTEGKFNKANSNANYWLGTNGDLVDTVPTSGMVQQIAKQIDDQNVLIHIDKTVIIL